MADKVDPQKHCASIADAKQRLSCEVLAQECNAQSDANASTYALTGADNRKRTYRTLTACHQAAASLPKQLGALPASRLAAAARQPSPQNYTPCSITGTPGTSKNEACRHMMDACSASTQTPIVLSTNQGNFSASTVESCRSMAVGLADTGRSLAQLQPKAPAATATSPQHETAPSSPQAATASQDAAAFYSACSIAGPEGSPKNQVCRMLVATCASASSSPYTIKTDHGDYTASQRETCVSMASGLADRGYLPAGQTSPPPDNAASKPSSPTAATTATTNPHSQTGAPATMAATEATPSQPQPDAGPRQVKPFADITNLRLRVTGEKTTEQRLLLLFGSIQGVPIRFRYSLTRVQGDQFRMRYSIYAQDETAPLGGEQTIDFSAPGNRINLGFELSLWSEGNYKPLRGIRVVSLG